MKNAQTFCTPEEIQDFFADLWKTDIFKEAYAREGSYLRVMVNHLAKYPIYTYEMTEDTIERAHFTSWWRGLAKRDYYENDIKHDLYFFHEAYHAALMPYIPDASPAQFKSIIGSNETDASVASEILIYLHMPGLREHVFKDYDILVDRFTADEKFMALWNNLDTRQEAYEIVRTLHRFVQKGYGSLEDACQAYQDHPAYTNSFKARQIAYHQEIKPWIDGTLTWLAEHPSVAHWMTGFNDQNTTWVDAWAERYNDVETHARELKRSVDHGMDPRKAMETFMAWLHSPEVMQDNIPFKPEAERFKYGFEKRKQTYVEQTGRPTPVDGDDVHATRAVGEHKDGWDRS